MKTRSECHQSNAGFYHKPVWIWIVNDKKEILVQKRASVKKSFPNYWDTPSAGHVAAGEKIIDGAIRETKEELGIDTKANDYQFIFEYVSEITWELGQVYLLKLNIETENFILQAEEVAQIKWLSFEDFKKMIYSKEFIPYDDEYKKLVVNFLQNELNIV